MSNRGSFALVVNPRGGLLYECYLSSTGHVSAHSLINNEKVGSGYFNDNINNKYGMSSLATGLPRVHTPSGVVTSGIGLGTVLYTALCTASHLRYENVLEFEADVDGDGISSQPGTRSREAEAWWTAAKERYGLASEVSGDVEASFSKTISSGYQHEVEQIVSSHFKGSDVDVKSYDLSVEGIRMQDVEGDAYPFDAATNSHLVVALCNDVRKPDFDDYDTSDWTVLDREALALLNMSTIASEMRGSEYRERAVSIAKWLLRLAQDAKVSARDQDAMRLRMITGVDIDPAAWEGFGAEAYETLRSNPPRRVIGRAVVRRNGRSVPVKLVATGARKRRLRGTPKPLPTQYGRRTNPAGVPRDMAASLSELNDRRLALGWGAFAEKAPK
jgi:hypothetical protein